MEHHSFLKNKLSVVVHNTDVSDRDKVLDELRKYFGYENVVPISTFNQLKLKSLVKDLSKFYNIPFEEVNIATSTVEQDVKKAIFKPGDDVSTFQLTFDDAMKHSTSFCQYMEKYPHLQISINVLFKQNRSLGRHAGGVLIADELPQKMPLITSSGEPQSPFVEGVNVKTLEKIGEFIKYDILGLETLRLIERTIELIITNNGGIVEFEVNNEVIRLPANTKVKLTNNTFVLASELSDNSDVQFPIEILPQ